MLNNTTLPKGKTFIQLLTLSFKKPTLIQQKTNKPWNLCQFKFLDIKVTEIYLFEELAIFPRHFKYKIRKYKFL